MKKILALILALVMVMALCACGAKEEAPAEAAPAAPAEAPTAPAAAPAEAPAAAPVAAPEGEASGEPTGEMPPLDASGSYTITVGGVTDEAVFSETDNGDQETKGIVITWQGVEYTGKIDKGVYTADDPAAQPIFDAYKAAFEANNTVGPASGEPSAEPAA